jgi:hypothetical protein
MHEPAAWGTQLNAGSPEAGRRPNQFRSGECLIGEQYAADRYVARITKNKDMLLLVFIILNVNLQAGGKLAKEMPSLGFAGRGFSLLSQRPHRKCPPNPPPFI